ncbi:MAG: pyruvate carboxylase subunit B [Chloroflexi bacterium]|nr:pyruvate carboxylase subunit B [Chloroflexota bacterium]
MSEGRNPGALKVTDTTFRDAHQSLLATRWRTEDMLPIASEMDKVGFWSLEVWGGATFDVATRFLHEDPWGRVRALKGLIPNTPLQMLLRGQNLVGYRHYPDDVVRAFVLHAAEVGIDIFRVFDALNDERNLEAAFAAIREAGRHIQGALCYSLTGKRLGGPVFNIDYYVNKALTLQKMGANSLCIKDMAGLIAPQDAYDLVRALKEALRIPICLHTHYTSGMASMSYLKAIEAGVDMVDTALAPLALRTSQPAIEPLLMTLQGTERDPGLDLHQLLLLGQFLESVASKYKEFQDDTRISVIDPGVLEHQIPGGMISNLMAQLKEAEAVDRLEEVYAELPRVRAELGYPPLVTPTSQIVGIQAVQNILFGRYKMVSAQVKDYVYGLYGCAPAPIDPEVQKAVLKGYERGEEPITCRPGDILPPELSQAQDATNGLARDMGDVLIYALYPTTGLSFLRRKYELETPPPAKLAPSEALPAVARARIQPMSSSASPRAPGRRAFIVYVEGHPYQVEVEPIGLPRPGGAVPVSISPAPAIGRPHAPTQEEAAIVAPMPGIVVEYLVKEGDSVKIGDIVVVLEAMKMENSLPSPIDGVMEAIHFKPGAQVMKGAVLATITPAQE